MTDQWRWYWGEGAQPETYYKVASREAAIDAATAKARETGYANMTICEGKEWVLSDNIFSADGALERWHDINEECQDMDGELGMNPTFSQRAELETALNIVFREWRARHGLGRSWAMDTRNAEVIVVDGSTAGMNVEVK